MAWCLMGPYQVLVGSNTSRDDLVHVTTLLSRDAIGVHLRKRAFRNNTPLCILLGVCLTRLIVVLPGMEPGISREGEVQ